MTTATSLATFVHEAGHALVAVRLGMSVVCIYADENGSGTKVGRWNRQGKLRKLTVICAGIAGECAAGVADPTAANDDAYLDGCVAAGVVGHLAEKDVLRLTRKAFEQAKAFCLQDLPALQLLAAELRKAGRLSGPQIKAIIRQAREGG